MAKEAGKEVANAEQSRLGDNGNARGFSFLSRNRAEPSKPISGTNDPSGDTNRRIDAGSETSSEGSGGNSFGSRISFVESAGSSNAGTSTDQGEAGISGEIDDSGRRGRHRRECVCQRCRDRRAGTVNTGSGAGRQANSGTGTRRSVSQNLPESVDWSDIFPNMTEGKTPQVADILSFGYATIFDLVRYARKEEHWSLSKQESAKLGKVTLHCVNTLDDGTKSKIVKRFEKQLPWLSLIGFGVVITAPRIAASALNEKIARERRFPAPIPFAKQQREETNATAGKPSEAASDTISEDRKSIFAPGPNPSFPPLDYVIPSAR